MKGCEKALGILWQPRLLGYSVALSGIGNQEGTEAVCIPISGQQHLEAVQGGAFSASPRAMAVLASLNQHDIVTSVAAGTARSAIVEESLRNFAGGTSTASALDKAFRGHAVNSSETKHGRGVSAQVYNNWAALSKPEDLHEPPAPVTALTAEVPAGRADGKDPGTASLLQAFTDAWKARGTSVQAQKLKRQL